MNEFFLWHGTKPSAALGILDTGFRIAKLRNPLQERTGAEMNEHPAGVPMIQNSQKLKTHVRS